MHFQLPENPIPDRVSLTNGLAPNKRLVCAELEGPGCIRHIWLAWGREDHLNRCAVIRIFFDDEPIPHVEAPVGDFFGVMHGKTWYPINTPHLSVKAESGYNCYFVMPFAKRARIEIESGERRHSVYVQVAWHRYPGAEFLETRRFCARWRREYPTERYGRNFLMLDADGPGELLGFVYGVRLDDNTDRWSHGGAENIYIDGEGDNPAYLRGIGGEDTFGTSYGGALHPPETHLYSGMPYYVHDDFGEARPAQRVVGYRFFDQDTIPFQHSLHMRFGCMRNDICATTYWYQKGPVRPFFKMPPWDKMRYLKMKCYDRDVSLPYGECDLELPESGDWWLCGPFGNINGEAMKKQLVPEIEFEPEVFCETEHDDNSPWLSDWSRDAGLDKARWAQCGAIHGFVDFNYYFRPRIKGVAPTYPGVAVARCILNAQSGTTAELRLSWDDSLVLRVNGECFELGEQAAFRSRSVSVKLRPGPNTVTVKLSNTRGTNHGGWAFAFRAKASDGAILKPEREKQS